MSRYDRERERKRFLTIAAIVVVFAGAAIVFGHISTQTIASADYETQDSR